MPGLAESVVSCSSFENKLQDSEEEPGVHARSLTRFRKSLRESLLMLQDSFVHEIFFEVNTVH